MRDELVALAWSLWAELGVSGWDRRHKTWFIDPEPLIVFTAWLGDEDARLRDEVTDWCIRFGSWISATRLANMVKANDVATEGFGELAATVGKHSVVRWRGATKPRAFKASHKSRLESFDSPSLVSLRLRALFGVGARAEIVRQLLSSPSAPQTASNLVDDAGFKKRNIAETFDTLRLGGALDSRKIQNKLSYRLRDPLAWRALLGELPDVWPRWSSLLPLLALATDAIERLRTLPSRSAYVETNRLTRSILSLAERADLSLPSARNRKQGLDAFEEWTSRIAAALAKGDPRVFETTSPSEQKRASPGG
jgi:hypothetical protein